MLEFGRLRAARRELRATQAHRDKGWHLYLEERRLRFAGEHAHDGELEDAQSLQAAVIEDAFQRGAQRASYSIGMKLATEARALIGL